MQAKLVEKNTVTISVLWLCVLHLNLTTTLVSSDYKLKLEYFENFSRVERGFGCLSKIRISAARVPRALTS